MSYRRKNGFWTQLQPLSHYNARLTFSVLLVLQIYSVVFYYYWHGLLWVSCDWCMIKTMPMINRQVKMILLKPLQIMLAIYCKSYYVPYISFLAIWYSKLVTTRVICGYYTAIAKNWCQTITFFRYLVRAYIAWEFFNIVLLNSL